jgi:hypothetical protein
MVKNLFIYWCKLYRFGIISVLSAYEKITGNSKLLNCLKQKINKEQL